MSRVYAKTDERGVIVRIDGGVSTPTDLSEWTLIDEGEGYRYYLCQSNYLPDLMGEDGVYNYKLVDGRVEERTEEEKEADRAESEETTSPSLEGRVSELEAAFEALMSGEVVDE